MSEDHMFRLEDGPEGTLEILSPEGSAITSLRGKLAERARRILQIPAVESAIFAEANCFGAMDFMVGITPEPCFVMSRALVRSWTDLDTAKKRFGYPFGFQLYGWYDISGELGFDETVDGVFHEGMVIGENGGEPVVFDKAGGLAAGVHKMSQVLAQFPEVSDVEVRCFKLPL